MAYPDNKGHRTPFTPAQSATRLRKQRCENCQHFGEAGGRELPMSTCRKTLPQLIVSPAGNVGGTWVPTRPELFCAHWEPLKPDAYENSAV
jgi:hypothetical protein